MEINGIKTSYFAKYKESNGISISRFTPKWFNGETYKRLSPSKSLLSRWKKGQVTESEFEQQYIEETLSKLKPEKIYSDLKGKVLLCYETSDKFCHRHIFARWITKELGIVVDEYKPKRYKKIVIGIDESYQETGIGIIADNKLLKEYGIKFPNCTNKTEKRRYLAKVINSIVKVCQRKSNNVILMVERIRTFSAKQKGGFSLSTNYIKSTAALIAMIVDIGYSYGINTYSVDTRSWKSKILGSSKSSGKSNNSTGSTKKSSAIKYILNKYGVDVSYRTKTGLLKYDDNRADAICIAEYGFLPDNIQVIKLEE